MFPFWTVESLRRTLISVEGSREIAFFLNASFSCHYYSPVPTWCSRKHSEECEPRITQIHSAGHRREIFRKLKLSWKVFFYHLIMTLRKLNAAQVSYHRYTQNQVFLVPIQMFPRSLCSNLPFGCVWAMKRHSRFHQPILSEIKKLSRFQGYFSLKRICS